MKKLLTLALLLFISCTDHDINPCKMATVSKALPIELWPADEEVYNEKEICGVAHDCWKQPWNCEDIIRIQFEEDSSDYEIIVVDKNDNILGDPIPASKTALEGQYTFTNEDFDVGMVPWGNADPLAVGRPAFGWQVGGTVRADGTTSESTYLYQENTQADDGLWPAGDYVVEYDIDNNSSGGSSPLSETIYVRTFMDDMNSPSPPAADDTDPIMRGSPNISVLTFTLATPVKNIGFQIAKTGPSTGSEIDVTINYLRMTQSPAMSYMHYAEFSFSDIIGACDNDVRVYVRRVSDEVIILKSDWQDVKEAHECTSLFHYWNNNDYENLMYDDVSPAQSFYLRLPMDFWQERPVEEMETHDLSNNKTIALNSQVKFQTLMDTDFLPMYMHKKITLILKHQNLVIDGNYYTQHESYNITPGNKRYSTKRGNVWLDQRDFVARNTM